jgi:hypothetical protein
LPTRILTPCKKATKYTNGVICAERFKVVNFFLYSDAYIEEQHHFTVGQTGGAAPLWPATGKPRRRPLIAASIPTQRPCSHTEDVNLQPRLIPVYRHWRDERPGGPEHVRVNILLKVVMSWPIRQSLDSNPGLLVLSQMLKTTRPTCL